ncbi:putative fibroblast growth factor 1 [Orussus abietinus]|uniref:putative fibroblast growth factor 1 n=1 Tax=Orussus abietinus TaxID=222816 RepID=UPI0006264188|nr:putative fibroblast growth factor 1 [Orussus abietinus]XP_012285570.1 putative fibroblast growth factor 1 [Orussus abietinus]XP_012285571.1 putative fibroblast growth factor 1 [Orussus abietinus]XP_012285572.1 putative fibroblast growth factor 1 [Orussus abietinus]XP_012285573.1 putative fibroblast growth factor 1 [Orussus abietinus]
MSLRWIQENCVAPVCDEESSDIDDSCSDDSYDAELGQEDEVDHRRDKRETLRPPTETIRFDDNGVPRRDVQKKDRLPLYVVWDPRGPAENPIYGSLVIQLYCRTGYHLAVSPSGLICGASATDESHALLSISTVSFGLIRIQCIETGLYVAFNHKGRLYGEPNVSKENTVWEQWKIGSYDAFRSRKYVELGWWIGIKKNGRPKLGSKTAWGQKAIQFSPRQLKY